MTLESTASSIPQSGINMDAVLALGEIRLLLTKLMNALYFGTENPEVQTTSFAKHLNDAESSLSLALLEARGLSTTNLSGSQSPR